MLLGPYNHSRSHEAHESNDLVSREAVTVNKISTDEATGAPKSGFAMHCDLLSLHGNDLVSKLDKLSHHWKRRACSIIK